MEEKITNKLVSNGWTENGAHFLASKSIPIHWKRRMFGKMKRDEKKHCCRCNYSGVALDWHHIHGKKFSDETIVVCSNCHRELHAGEWSV